MRTTLFDLRPEPKPPRQKPRVLMHVFDAGPGEETWGIVRFQCLKCGDETDWMRVETMTEAKRGIPCPKCNNGYDWHRNDPSLLVERIK